MKCPKIRITKPTINEDEIIVESSQLVDLSAHEIVLRNSGVLKNKAVFLPTYIAGKRVNKWIIVKDEVGNFCLVPLIEK